MRRITRTEFLNVNSSKLNALKPNLTSHGSRTEEASGKISELVTRVLNLQNEFDQLITNTKELRENALEIQEQDVSGCRELTICFLLLFFLVNCTLLAQL